MRRMTPRVTIPLALAALLASCATEHPPRISPADAHAMIEQSLPNKARDAGWGGDIYTAFETQRIEPSRENICAVVAVIEQESNFQVNPVIPGLPAIAWKQIRARAGQAHVPWMLVNGALGLSSPGGLTYAARIDRARTEKDLSDIYEDFISSVPLGRTLFEDHNPIRTRGPMQVNVAFLKQTAAVRSYPYPVQDSMAGELFTRRGSIYYGVAHLLGYPAPYPSYLYRFADFNAGQFSSRNAAFQNAVSVITHRPLTPDGALLPGNGDVGETQSALRDIEDRLSVNDRDIETALEQGRTADFEHTRLYERVFETADRARGHALPRAMLPRIKLQGPKISRNLTTEWYARRVDGRFQQCLKR